MWNVKEDTFSISYRETESKEEVTKRRILSLAHRIFDPIGFTCPITLIPKLLIQECWKIEASWDSKLPVDIERKFEAWKKQLIEIQDIKIPRRLSNLDLKDANLSLQVFCDASKLSYATCIFLRAEREGEVTCQLIQARSKVAPLKDDVEDLEPLTPAMFLQDIREVGVPELNRIDENKFNKRLVYRNRIQTDLRKRFRVEYLGQLRKIKNIKGEDTLSEGDIVLVGDDHTKRINWNLGKILKLYPGKDEKVRAAQVKTKLGTFLRPVQKLYLLEVMEKNKSSVHPTNSPLFSDANGGSHLPINIDSELSKHQAAATPSTQPCSSVSNGGARLEPRAETISHQQAETSSMQPCSSVSNGGGGLKLRAETSGHQQAETSSMQPIPVFPMVKPE
ncbi:DUF5641 domain-containing protein, partial [Trichonephila clavata]